MAPVEISIYCDESEPQSIDNEHWVYYGLLIVPENEKKELYNRLINARCIPNNKWVQNGCGTVCGFHEKNNTELHYNELSRNHEYRISKKWIKLLYNECMKNERIIYFNILGLNKTLIDKKYWQHHKNKSIKIYGRFLFTAIKSIKYFFPTANTIRLNRIFHDNAALGEDSSPYYYRLIDDLRRDRRIELHDSKIHFIDSDHRISTSSLDSHFLQFIDLLLGLAVNYVHYSSKNQRKTDLTNDISDLYKRLINEPRNKNSRYNYYRQKRIEFFPRNRDF